MEDAGAGEQWVHISPSSRHESKAYSWGYLWGVSINHSPSSGRQTNRRPTQRGFGAVVSGAAMSTMTSVASSPSNGQIRLMKLFTTPMPLFACPCDGSQVATPVPFLHFITVIINEQSLSLITSLLPVNPQPRVIKMGWNLSLIFMVDILSSGFCWWAPRHWVVGLSWFMWALSPFLLV